MIEHSGTLVVAHLWWHTCTIAPAITLYDVAPAITLYVAVMCDQGCEDRAGMPGVTAAVMPAATSLLARAAVCGRPLDGAPEWCHAQALRLRTLL